MGGLTSLFGGSSKPKAPPIITPPRAPSVDEAAANLDQEERARRRRGRLADMRAPSVLDTANPAMYQSGGKSVLGG